MKKYYSLIVLFILAFNLSAYSQWQRITSIPSSYFEKVIFSGSTLYAINLNNGVYKSTDGTASWVQVNTGLNVSDALRGYDIIFSGPNLYIATVDGIYKSTNNAASWVKKSTGLVIGSGSNNLFAMSLFEDSGVMYAGTYSGIYRSTDSGENWVVTNISGSAVMATSFIKYNGIFFCARETNNSPGSYKSTDNGLTWSPFAITGSYLPSITFFDDNTRLYAGTIDGVWVSTNNGLNWASRNQGLSLDPYSSSIIRVNGVLFTSLKFGGSGIYRSFNDGLQWEDIGTGLPFLGEIAQLIVYQDKILAATSAGIYQRPIGELVPVANNNETVSGFSLSQNYPNPFNPATKIKFDISGSVGNAYMRSVHLKVFDVLGREVVSLVDQNMKPGEYEIEFNASELPSGVYFYKLESSGFTSTRKMLLIK